MRLVSEEKLLLDCGEIDYSCRINSRYNGIDLVISCGEVHHLCNLECILCEVHGYKCNRTLKCGFSCLGDYTVVFGPYPFAESIVCHPYSAKICSLIS